MSDSDTIVAIPQQGPQGMRGAQGAPGVAGTQGNSGAQGPVGPGYAATSVSSLLIGTGSKSFTTQAGLAYSAGVRVRASSAGNTANWMEGICASYSGTTLIVTVATVGGSGTFADWNINCSGELGATGPTGPTGPSGSGSGDMLKSTYDPNTDGKIDIAQTTGFGTAAALNVGTGANQVVQMNGSAKLPAIDGSNLTNIPSAALTGSIVPYGGVIIPAGYLECDGTAVSRATYAALLAALINTHTVTLTIASPCVVSWTAHGLKEGMPFIPTTTGALPTNLTPGVTYYVKGPTTNAFNLSATPGGAAINTTGSQSGTHTGTVAPWGIGDGSTTFNVPQLRGEFLRGWDDGRGVDTNRGFGSAQSDLVKDHTHSLAYTIPAGATETSAGDLGGIGGSSSTTGNMSSGGGTETRPRNIAVMYLIKT